MCTTARPNTRIPASPHLRIRVETKLATFSCTRASSDAVKGERGVGLCPPASRDSQRMTTFATDGQSVVAQQLSALSPESRIPSQEKSNKTHRDQPQVSGDQWMVHMDMDQGSCQTWKRAGTVWTQSHQSDRPTVGSRDCLIVWSSGRLGRDEKRPIKGHFVVQFCLATCPCHDGYRLGLTDQLLRCSGHSYIFWASANEFKV